ncbi:MAG TPA: tetratricopeptide repeat protein [Aequorivita sp.]|nr:tetratricopeptide repeat protein [Aequorivita sp.]
MLHKPYKDKVGDIAILYKNTIQNYVEDSVSVKDFTVEMKKWALANDDQELALEAELLMAYSKWHVYGYKKPELIKELIDVADKAEKQNMLTVDVRAAKTIATHYWIVKNYEKAFIWLLRTERILEKLNSDSYPNMAEHLSFIGNCYYHFADYSNAIIYFEKASKIKKSKFNSLAVLEAQNSLGLCYQKLKNFDKSNESFIQIINDSSEFSNKTWKGIATGNLGYNYYLQGDFNEAIPLFNTDISLALKNQDYGLAAGSTIPLADIYLQQHQLKKSKDKIDESVKYIQLSKQTDRLRKLYPILSKWYAANNEPDKSMKYLDSAMIANQKYQEKFNSLKLLHANQIVEAKEREIEIQRLNTESQLKLSQRNFIILIIAILLTGSIFAFWLRNKILLKRQYIKELELDNTRKALSNAKNMLENTTLRIRQDHKLITELKRKKATEENNMLLAELKSKNILTQADWLQYKNLFKQAYPQFLPSLQASYPELSQAEIRYLCLEKLQLNNNEMALVLGVSSNTVRVTKHRIRKKLNLESQEQTETLIDMLETKIASK